MNLHQFAAERYHLSAGSVLRPWIPTVDRFHHQLLIELLPSAAPLKQGLGISAKNLNSNVADTSVRSQPLSFNTNSNAAQSKPATNSVTESSYRWRLSLWSNPEQRLTCDAYAQIEIDDTSCVEYTNTVNDISANYTDSLHATDLKSNVSPSPRSTSKPRSQPHATQPQHKKHNNKTSKGTVYVVDLDWLTSLLLSNSSSHSTDVMKSASASDSELQEIPTTNDRKPETTPSCGDSGNAELNWSIDKPLYLVVELIHKTSGLVVSRGAGTFQLAASDETMPSDLLHNEPSKLLLDHCYRVEINTEPMVGRSPSTDAILMSQRDARRQAKTAITHEHLPTFTCIMSYARTVDTLLSWGVPSSGPNQHAASKPFEFISWPAFCPTALELLTRYPEDQKAEVHGSQTHPTDFLLQLQHSCRCYLTVDRLE